MEFISFLLLLGILAVVLDALVFHKFIKSDTVQEELAQKELEKLRTEKDLLTQQNARLGLELEKKSEEVGQAESKLEREQSEKNELQGKNKQMFVNLTALQERMQSLQSNNEELNKKVVQGESQKEKHESDFERKVSHLEESRKALEDERIRIRREDEARLAQEEAERNRIWAEHENVSIAKMKEICVKPELSFRFFGNTDLPDSFDGKLKPDFLVEFLGQYIIFDAKMTRSETRSLQDYINDQIKSTAKKIQESRNKDEIYPSVFFIVPQNAVHTLKKTCFYEDGFSFFVIAIDAFEPVLQGYKKITFYDTVEAFDPKERENIVNIIAAYDQHIHKQNAINILSSVEGLRVSQLSQDLSKDMKIDVDLKKQKMRIENFKPTDLKRFIHNPEEQIAEIRKLVTPEKPQIEKADLENAAEQNSLF